MSWEVEYTNEFGYWWESLGEDEQDSIDSSVILLEEMGPHLPFPHSSGINGSRFNHMRELRIQHRGNPYRIIYAFDPRRVAILLIGGNKGGDERWYDKFVSIADDIYAQHLETLTRDGLI